MNTKDQDYTLSVLKMVVNLHLDSIISTSKEDLEFLELNRDQVVWKVSTKIYSQSGHKIEFHTVRDVLDSRMSDIKSQLVSEQRALALEAEQGEQRALEAKQRAKKHEIEAAIRKSIIAQRVVQKFTENKNELLDEFKGNERKLEIFFRVCSIICVHLQIDVDHVNLNSNISNDLNVDEIDAVELALPLEEEFDIEIPDETFGEIYTVEDYVEYFYEKSLT